MNKKNEKKHDQKNENFKNDKSNKNKDGNDKKDKKDKNKSDKKIALSSPSSFSSPLPSNSSINKNNNNSLPELSNTIKAMKFMKRKEEVLEEKVSIEKQKIQTENHHWKLSPSQQKFFFPISPSDSPSHSSSFSGKPRIRIENDYSTRGNSPLVHSNQQNSNILARQSFKNFNSNSEESIKKNESLVKSNIPHDSNLNDLDGK